MPTTDITTNQITAGLWMDGLYWGASDFTYSVPTSAAVYGGAGYGSEPTSSFSVLNSAETTGFIAAITQWDRLIAPNFTQVADGNIRVAFTSAGMSSGTWGFAGSPPPGVNGAILARNGDIWINSTNARPLTLTAGAYDLSAMLHEIGHALGLKHSFDGPTTIPAAFDNTGYTLMSYTDAPNSFHPVFTGNGLGTTIAVSTSAVFAATPMVLDIAAIQARYGADTTTATGNDTYVFSQDALYFQAIYDAGGTDTFDTSTFTRSSTIDLRPGAYSSLGSFSVTEQRAAAEITFNPLHFPSFTDFINTSITSSSYTWTNNVGIAFATTIENAIGGSAADTITGNDAANLLEGRAGNDTITGGLGGDTLIGGLGNDSLDGGSGTDTLSYAGANGASSGVTISLALTTAQATGGAGTDTVTGFENLVGSSFGDTLTGGSDGNRITGGAGADTINGGSNVDTAVFAGAFNLYTITHVGLGATVTGGTDGGDTLTNVEYFEFADRTIHFRPGTGVSINFTTADPDTYMGAIRDFDGNNVGAPNDWLRIGQADLQGDGDIEQIFVNRVAGRWASVGPADDGLVYFSDHGWAGDTRVVGTYIDPLVENGTVVQGGPNDSQRRFQNDLNIENINGVLGAGDYDHDGLQEVYFHITDGTAYLHAYMHADGNIRYANYQSQQQVIDYLTGNGFGASTYAGWFS